MFQGTYTALITPFRDKKIDYDSLEKLILFQIENNVTGIVLCGTTGESPTLTYEEYRQLLTTSLEIIQKRVQCIVGTGSNNTRTSIEKTHYAKELGVDGALVVAPYYNKPNQKGLYEHFSSIAHEGNLPIIMYNIPSRTGVNITSDTIIALSKQKNILSVKESSGDLLQVMRIIQSTSESFTVLSGDDVMTVPLMSIGGHGVVSVMSNICPSEVVDIVQSCLFGNMEDARKLHYKYLDLMDALFVETNPAPVKYALSLMKGFLPELRSPLVDMSEENKQYVKSILEDLSIYSHVSS